MDRSPREHDVEPAGKRMKITPVLEQYLRIKEEHPDALLFFRLGDFFELFFEDAERAARLLDITLTTRSKKDEIPIPMCGVPHHAVQSYVAKLMHLGLKVALCDQMEDPATAKGIVSREVVRVLTPGTLTEEEYLDPKRPNYLAAVCGNGERPALVYTDLSTGELCHAQPGGRTDLLDTLSRLAPREVLLASEEEELAEAVRRAVFGVVVSPVPAERFDADAGRRWLEQGASDVAAAVAGAPSVSAALGAVLWYLGKTHRGSLSHLRPPRAEEDRGAMVLDEATRRNLELLATARGERRGSLLWVLDETATPMGGRLLRQWLLAPSTDPVAIGIRLDAVEELLRSPSWREEIVRTLGGIGDLERLSARLTSARVTPRDLLGLGTALDAVETLCGKLSGVRVKLLADAAVQMDPLPDVRARIAVTLADDPPLNPRAGNLIRPGFDARVDELRELAHHGKRTIGELEAAERARTGITSLKVRYNQVFGYYIEVTNPNLHLVPEHFRRKQTLVNAERFVTPELEEYEAKVLGAEERLAALEAQLFEHLVSEVAARHASLSETAAALARVDVLASLARVAERNRYARPTMTRERRIFIEEGRHPVVELMAGRQGFVPNDCLLDPDDHQILVLTGPNMAGKSTYLRQVALITLMAQMGSFVPALHTEIGIVDRLFTRIGASDNLAGGESTFMVEMKETARILNELTPRSLVILDEIGRGTSTFDGISIAWAVAEQLHDGAELRPLVLFATHYHELTDLARTKPRVQNFSVAVREWKGEVVFLRRVVPGPSSQSYGIQVARLAGVPDSIVARAGEILRNLECGELTDAGLPRLAEQKRAQRAPEQLALFGHAEEQFRTELAALDVERMTPLEALTRLHELRDAARKGGR
jgi:DNA mismatch repair protein MutS